MAYIPWWQNNQWVLYTAWMNSGWLTTPTLPLMQQVRQTWLPRIPGETSALQGFRPLQPKPVPASPPASPARFPAAPAHDRTSGRAKAEKKATPGHKPRVFTASGLTQEDADVLTSLYGDDIEDVYDLSAGQRWMLDQSGQAENAFFLQILIKANITADPPDFRRRVDLVSESRDSLRSAFVTEGISHPVRVVLKHRRVEIEFRDISDQAAEVQKELLERFMLSDRQRGFDLARDALLRISCFRLAAERNAFLISQPHIDSDGTTLMLLVKDIILPFMQKGVDTAQVPMQGETSDREYGRWLAGRNTDAELAYWKEKLSALPSFVPLPGREGGNMGYEGHTHTMTLSEEATEKLSALQGPYRATIANIMQAAWAAYLMQVRGTGDIMYGLVTAGRDAPMADSLQLTGGFINVLPMRAKADEQTKLSDLTAMISRSQVEAMKNSHCSVREIQNALHRSDRLFDHLLNFQNFASAGGARNGGLAAAFGFEIQTYDNLSEDLCIYFVKPGRQYVCNFSYNSNAITEDAVRLLAEGYQHVLEQIADGGSDLTVADLKTPKIRDFERLEMLKGARLLRYVQAMRNVRAFHGLGDLALWDLALQSRVTQYRENDIVVTPEKTPEDVLILLSGMMEYTGVNTGGWTVPIRMIPGGRLINAECLWNHTGTNTGKKARRGAVVSSESATVLLIPRTAYEKLMADCPAAAVNLMQELHDSMIAMERLWLTV